MNFFKMLSPMRTKMIGYVTLLLFLLPSMEVMGQCDKAFSIATSGCDVTFTPSVIDENVDYCWTVTHENGITLTSTSIIADFSLPPQNTTEWTVNLIIKDGTVELANCTDNFFADCLFFGCFLANPRINCSQLLVNVIPVNLPGDGPYRICPGDGSDCYFTFLNGPEDVCYSNINTVETPQVTITILDFQTNEVLCSEVVVFPEEGIFIGKLCETTTISDLVNGGTTDIPDPLFPPTSINGNDHPNIYLSGNLVVDQSYTFENIDVYTGTNSEIDVQPAFFFANLTLRNGTNVGPQPECVCIWRGINVIGTARLTTNPVATEDRVKIFGALYATRAILPTTATFFTPSVSMRNTDLERNFIGFRGTDGRFRLRLSGTVFDGSGGLQTINCNTNGLCPLENDLENQVDNTNFPFMQNQGYAGIFIDGIRGSDGIDGAFLNIPEVTGEGTINTFQNLSVGILVDEANATIRSCQFRDIERYGYENNSGFGIRFIDGGGDEESGNHFLDQVGEGSNVNNFNRVEHGIFASSHGLGTVANIFSNNMTNVQFGITLSSPNDGPGTVGNITDAEVRSNRITVSQNFMNASIFQAPYGIAAFDRNPEPSEYLIRNNIINMDLGFPTGGVGIWALGMGNTADRMNIQFNTDVNLIQGLEGIRVENWHRADVYANIIDIFSENLAFGIAVRGGNGCRVRCNRVEAMEENNAAQAVFITFSRVSQLLENDLFSTNVGISVDGPCETSNLTCNDMNAPMGTGLLYSNFNDGMGNFTTTSPQNNKANRWWETNGTFGVGAQHAGAFNVIGMSPYTTQPLPPFLPPSVFSANPFWFGTTSEPNIDCNFCNAFITDPEVEIDEIDEKIITDDLDGVADAIKYLLARGLFEKLGDNPELPNVHIGAQQFLDENQDKAIGLFYQYQKELEDLFKIPPATRLILDNNNLDIKTALEAIRNIDLQLVDDPTNEPLHIDRFNQANIIDDKTAANKAIYQVLKAQRLAGADDLLVTLADIPATEDYEINEKMVSEMYVEAFVKGNTLTNSQWNFIEGLAYTCGTLGGPGVFLARSMYSWKTGIPVNNPACVGEGSSNFVQNNSNTNEEFGVFPNPNAGNFTIRIPNSYIDNPVTIMITDITGKIIKQQLLTLEETTLDLDIAKYPDGIYFLKVFDKEVSIYTDKIILTK